MNHKKLSELFKTSPSCKIYSKVLGEEVLFAADMANLSQIPPEDKDIVVYRQSELKRLSGTSPEKLKAIHKVKKQMDGEIMS
jgi:hypothetical protein